MQTGYVRRVTIPQHVTETLKWHPLTRQNSNTIVGRLNRMTLTDEDVWLYRSEKEKEKRRFAAMEEYKNDELREGDLYVDYGI